MTTPVRAATRSLCFDACDAPRKRHPASISSAESCTDFDAEMFTSTPMAVDPSGAKSNYIPRKYMHANKF